MPANLSKLSAAQIVLSISFSPFPTRLSSFAQNRVKKQKANFISFCLSVSQLRYALFNRPSVPLPFHSAAKTPSKTPCFPCFHPRIFQKPVCFFSCLHSLHSFLLFFVSIPPFLLSRFSLCIYPLLFRFFSVSGSSLSCFCLPAKSGSVVFTKNPRGYPGSFSFGPLFKNPCMRANRLPFYVVRNRFVLFFLFPIYFLFSPPPCRVFLHKKTGP